jgi:ubiquinol-cytochrome c reductase cytochrome b subunit
MTTMTGKAIGGGARFVDERLTSSNFVRRSFNKVFPDHWSFMIGEIALYSFIILLLTGVYLMLFFDATSREVIYNGSYVPLKGVPMSEAYSSTLHLSFDVRGGLVIRQIHHWAALLFVSSIIVHLMRVFFTGAFRKPREINWVIGFLLLLMGVLEGFAGYSLPDDLLSGTGLRIAYSVALSIPVVGTWMSFLLFGGNFPGESIIGRLYVVHILLVPGIILALITAHMMILWYQKHTQFRGPGRTEENVVGSRMYPTYAAKGGGFFFLVFGVVAALGGLAQINPVWLYGPFNPSQVTAGAQPDWYIGFLEGSLRLTPGWEIRALGHTIPVNVLLPGAILPGLMFGILAAYPFLEARFTKDKAQHHLLDRPRDRPVRTSLGVMALTFYFVLWIMGANDIVAHLFRISLNLTTYIGQVSLFALPPIMYYVTYRICMGLQRADHDVASHGVETGTVQRLPSGEYIEVHAPVQDVPLVLSPVEPDHPERIDRDRGPRSLVSSAGRAVAGFFVAKKDSGAPDEGSESDGRRDDSLTRR